MLETIYEFIENWYVWWLVIGLVTGLIDLKHFHKTKGNITARHILDLLYFIFLGLVGLLMFLKIHGDEIVLIKKKKEKK